MATTYAHEGDTIIIDGQEFKVVTGEDNPYTLIPHVIVCEACGVNDASDYETGTGRHLCPHCVNMVLAARVVTDVLNDPGAFDQGLGRAMEILDADDDAMRRSGTSYVDSNAAAWDLIRGMNHKEAREFLEVIVDCVFNATREPGTV